MVSVVPSSRIAPTAMRTLASIENNAEKSDVFLMAEYCEEAVKGAFVSMSCHTCLKEGIKMVDLKKVAEQVIQEAEQRLKKFRIVVSAGPDVEVDIKTRDPCDALAISGALVKTLRMMDKEPKAKVMS